MRCHFHFLKHFLIWNTLRYLRHRGILLEWNCNFVFKDYLARTKNKSPNFVSLDCRQISICFINWMFPGLHCVKSVRIRSYSGPHFLAFELNTDRYGVSLHIQSECGKMRTRITPNMDTFHAVLSFDMFLFFNNLARQSSTLSHF